MFLYLLVAVLARAAVVKFSEDGGKILTGSEAAIECDVGDCFFGFLQEHFDRFLDPDLVEILHGGQVGYPPTVVNKARDAQSAIFGHGFQRPGFGYIMREGFEKELCTSSGRGERRGDADFLCAKQFKEM